MVVCGGQGGLGDKDEDKGVVNWKLLPWGYWSVGGILRRRCAVRLGECIVSPDPSAIAINCCNRWAIPPLFEPRDARLNLLKLLYLGKIMALSRFGLVDWLKSTSCRERSFRNGWIEDNQREGTPMTLVIEIKPEVQAELSRQAAAHGVDIAAYAASLLEEAAQLPSPGKRLNQGELDETLRELSQFSQKIPLLPEEAFSRENLYRDHD
jgi:hypothetical protein